MITIQSLMLVTLGLLIAGLIGFALAPAYRARTIRLTTERLRRSLPMTIEEIQAEKDGLRAEYALRLHRLEDKVERARLSSARQLIAINRRDARISSLEGELAALKSDHEEVRNARAVLEQTVADRLPKVEHRLGEARKLLYQRDREIAALTAEAEKTARALEEAMQMNTQSRVEIERLVTTLETRAAQNREGLSDPKFDGEVAMRAEIEALRARNREQAAVLSRLQRAEAAGIAAGASPALVAAGGGVLEGEAGDVDIARLKRDLADAVASLELARESAAAGQAGLESQLRDHKSKLEDQASEIARLTAAVAAFEQGATDERSISLKDSKIAIKAKLSSLQAQVESQTQTIQKLRAELASANEKMARQAAHFMEEMRRLGAGTLPATAKARRPGPAASRRTLAERITQVRPDLANAIAQPARPANDVAAPPAAAARTVKEDEEASSATTPGGREDARDDAATRERKRAPGLLKALAEQSALLRSKLPAKPAAAESAAEPLAAKANGTAQPAGEGQPATSAGGPSRPRLVDRITNFNKE